MRKELLLVSGLLIGSMAFAIDPAEIDSLIDLKGVVVSANRDPCEPEQCAIIYLGHRTGGD